MMYSVVVFDWDGTIMDSTPSIATAIQHACRDMNLPIPTIAQASWVIGLSLGEALRRAVPTLQPSQEAAFLERYRINYLRKDTELQLFPGVIELLTSLKEGGVRLAVATGKSRIGLERVFERTGLRTLFEATRTADETFSKPHPAMLLELMDEMAVSPEEMIMVGDTSHDLDMAHNAQVHSIGVTYGAHPRSELEKCQPQTIVEQVSDLREWLLSRCKINV